MAVKNENHEKIVNQLAELSVLVARWGDVKSRADALTKEAKKDGDKIKAIMTDAGYENSSSGRYTANIQYATSEKLDEDGMIHYIKSEIWGDKGSMHCPYIKTVEVIDFEALEKAIYHGDITQEQVAEMGKFKTVTKTPKLYLKVSKED